MEQVKAGPVDLYAATVRQAAGTAAGKALPCVRAAWCCCKAFVHVHVAWRQLPAPEPALLAAVRQ